MRKLNSLTVGVITALFVSAPAYASDDTAAGIRYSHGDEIIIQGFHWNTVREQGGTWYNHLETNAASIAALGVTSIWMVPPWRDWSSWNNGSTYGGGEGYMPFDFVKDSQYGSDTKLKDAALALTNNNVKVYYDIVANHRDKRKWEDAETQNSYPAWDPGGDKWAKNCWIPCENWGGSIRDDGDPFVGAEGAYFFDLNTAHADVYNDYKNELINLVDNYHAAGFRWDFVRGFDPARVDAWMDAVEAATNESLFSVGELWKDPISQSQLYDWADDGQSTVMDFELKRLMNSGDIFSWRWGLNGNPRQDWRERAVTFRDNHDTGASPGSPTNGQSHWPLPNWAVEHAYAYILMAPGTPVVYWPDAFDWGHYNLIQDLIATRKLAGITASSGIRFENSTGSGIAATVFGNDREVKISIGSTVDYSSTGYTLQHSGSWGKIWIEPQTSTTVGTHFFCGNGYTQPGQNVYVVGDIPELGSWNTSNAIKLNPSNYPEWEGYIELPRSTAIEWKCIIKDGSNNVISWEPGSNNQHTTAAEGGGETDGMF